MTTVQDRILPREPVETVKGSISSDSRDGENRLKTMRSLAGSPAPERRIGFEYDHKGRRIRQTVWNDRDDGQGSELSDLVFLYDGWNLIATLNPQLSTLNCFVWGLDLSGSLQGAGGVRGLLAMSYYGSATTNCFVAFDGNGNVAALLNAADSSAGAQYEYGPFGEVIRATGPMAKANPFRFSTKYQDDETDLVMYPARPYSPSLGRWLSRDPVEELGGLNIYGFVKNNPQALVDPYGLSWINIIRNLPLPPDLIERLYAWLIARMVDNQFVKVTKTEDVRCPKGSSRHLLSESDQYVEDRNEISLNIVDYDIISFRVYNPKEHIVVKTYGCCNNCWGFDTKGWNETKEEKFTDIASEGFDFDIVSGEIAVKEHTVVKKRWRQCREAVAPLWSWTEWDFPKVLK